MLEINRSWLRSFLRLDARARKEGIPETEIRRQEDTVLAAVKALAVQPGVVLADEVGMGKTFEALGVAAATRQQKPKARIVIVTPGLDLNVKWAKDINQFREMFDFGTKKVHAVDSVSAFIEGLRSQGSIVLVPVTVFQSGRGQADQQYLLALYAWWKELHGNTFNSILSRAFPGKVALQVRPRLEHELFLGVFDFGQVQKVLHERVFQKGKGSGAPGLDDLYQEFGLDAFAGKTEQARRVLSHALHRARFELTGRLIPTIDLLIVDEAHKLKNPGSLRTEAMRHVFGKGFYKSVLLTATPFQLDIRELKEVFGLFQLAKNAPPRLSSTFEDLLEKIATYQAQYDAFQTTWSALDPEVAQEFCRAYEEGEHSLDSLEDPSLQIVVAQVRELKHLKTETIEPGLRAWMIRSLRAEKRSYRQSVRQELRPVGDSVLPFLVYERLIAELFRRGQGTHKAAVEVNMVSSYAAAADGAMIANTNPMPEEAEAYRQLLREILDELRLATHHPKLEHVVTDAVTAAEQGEKTLIFCSRIASLEQLRRDLEQRWEQALLQRWQCVYPGIEAAQIAEIARGLQTRFNRPQDPLFLALREHRLLTRQPLGKWASQCLDSVVEQANCLLENERLSKSSAERVDYGVARACVERAVAQLWSAQRGPKELDPAVLEPLMHAAVDTPGEEGGVETSPRAHQARWRISPELARMVIGQEGGLWERLSEELALVHASLRDQVVERVARYLTAKQVPFLPELLKVAKLGSPQKRGIESAALLACLPDFWCTTEGKAWLSRLADFVRYLAGQTREHQEQILQNMAQTTGTFVRHTREGETRERLREMFNTPLFPMVLVVNEVMQEGLDLHRQCRRVVHHDLVWNPAAVEQRIGRIDRLGSLTSRLREKGMDAKLEVLYPVIHATIDERMYRTVKTREKWLEFLLGAVPEFSAYAFGDELPPALPNRLARELAVNLAPQSPPINAGESLKESTCASPNCIEISQTADEI